MGRALAYADVPVLQSAYGPHLSINGGPLAITSEPVRQMMNDERPFTPVADIFGAMTKV